jgi:hypothetical protein
MQVNEPDPSPAQARVLRIIQKRSPPHPRRIRTPNCTHINMDRLYTRDDICYVCGRVPSLGFLYVCRQDNDGRSHPPPLDINSDDAFDSDGNTKSELRQELEGIGLSEWIITSAERGEYTPAQLEKLKAQKLNVYQTIYDIIQRSEANSLFSQLSLAAEDKSSSATDGAIDAEPLKNPVSTSTLPRIHPGGQRSDNPQLAPECYFQACHTCRPYYKDRIYSSIESALSPTTSPLSSAEASSLPTKSSQTMRSIGLQPLSTIVPPLAAVTTRDDTGVRSPRPSTDGEADWTDESGSEFSACAREGNEVEVRDGVALTEEAVETCTPDILEEVENVMTQV